MLTALLRAVAAICRLFKPQPSVPSRLDPPRSLSERVHALGDDGRVPIEWLARPYRIALMEIRDAMRLRP